MAKSAFLRKLVLYGFVYDVDYSQIREMNALIRNIGENLNQIAKRMFIVPAPYVQILICIDLRNNIIFKVPSYISNYN